MPGREARGPPPTVWWSTPDTRPDVDGSQLSPSSSVKAMRLAGPASCATKVLPVWESVNRIGSSVRALVNANDTSCQLAAAGVIESSKLTRRVSSPAMNMTLPVFQLTPRLGSPALWPRGDGAG